MKFLPARIFAVSCAGACGVVARTRVAMMGSRNGYASLLMIAALGIFGIASPACAAGSLAADADNAAATPGKAATHHEPGATKVVMGDDFSGTWTHDPTLGLNPGRAKPTDTVFTLSDGTEMPFTPAAEKVYRERVVMETTQHAFANTSSRCLPIGTPGNMMGAPYPVRISQDANFIGMMFEEGWMFRAIYMNDKHPDEVIPSFMGHSIGHWEGKTLVIDTIALREETTLNFTGLPHSAQMRVVERINRTKPDTLVDTIQITDPVMYTKPLKFVAIFLKTNVELIEYVCESNRVEVTPDGRQTYTDALK